MQILTKDLHQFIQSFASMIYKMWYIFPGNHYLHALTKDRQQKLRVEVADIRGEMHYAEYETTTVGDEASK